MTTPFLEDTLTIDQFLLAESLLRRLYTGKMSEADVRLTLDKLEKSRERRHIAILTCVQGFIRENPEMFPYLA